VLLYCPKKGFIKAKVLSSNRRVRRFFGRESFDVRRLNAFKHAFVRRFELDHESFRTVEDVEQFIATRANQLRMTPLRPMKCTNPDTDLESLFQELIGGPSLQPRPRIQFPELKQAFSQPTLAGRIQFNKQVELPTLGKVVTVPYAYRNGTLNLIKPCGFAGSQEEVMKRAAILALEGHLFHKHRDSSPTPMQLIVVSRFAISLENVRDRIASTFDECHVRHVPDGGIAEFIEEIRSQAHA
jgi:hypothetical protein